MTEQELLAMSDDEYMNDAQLAFFKQRLDAKRAVLQQRLTENQAFCKVERQPDDVDFATIEEQRNIAMSMIDRDREDLRRINQALVLIEEGEYGYCLESGDPIGLKRLLLVPESVYSVETMRIRELQNKHHAKVA